MGWLWPAPAIASAPSWPWILAVTLAAATLALFLAVIAVGGALRAGLAPWPGLVVVVMATTAYVVSREQGSFLVAGLLAASGVVGVVYGLVTTEFLWLLMFRNM